MPQGSGYSRAMEANSIQTLWASLTTSDCQVSTQPYPMPNAHPIFLLSKSLISISEPSFGKTQLPHTILASLLMFRSLVHSSSPIHTD